MTHADLYQCYMELKKKQFWLKSDIEISDDYLSQLFSTKSHFAQDWLIPIKELLHNRLNLPMSETCCQVHYLKNSTFNILFEMTSTQHASVIIKLSAPNIPTSQFDLYAEKMTYNILKKNNILSVNIQEFCFPCKEHPFAYIMMEKLNGFPLFKLTLRPNHEVIGCVYKLGALLARLHLIKIEGYGTLVCNVEDNQLWGIQNTWQAYLQTSLHAHLKYCIDHHIIETAILHQMEYFFDKFNLIQDVIPSLLHGDLSSHNVFINYAGNPILIDWGDALSGDPVFDLAMWGSFLGNDEKLHFLLNGYQTIANLPEDFFLRYWIYYLRIILAKTVHRYRFQYSKNDKILALCRIQKPLNELASLF